MNLAHNILMISTTRGVQVIEISSIVRIEALDSYSRLYLANGRTVLVSKVLRLMEELLSGEGFVRIHRSHLVNTRHVLQYDLHQFRVRLSNMEEISMSRRKSIRIRRLLFSHQNVYLRKKDKIISPGIPAS